MAVSTDLCKKDLKIFIKEYDVGELDSFKSIIEGVENSNFLLKTSKGLFILTLYEKRVKENDLPFFIRLMDYLYLNGLNCPQPLHRLDGKTYGRLSSHPANIFSFLEGTSLHDPKPQHCQEFGAALASMHKATKGFNFYRKNELSLFGWKALWEKCCTFKLESTLKNEINSELAFLKKHWPTKLPQGIIHADLFPDNVFLLGNQFSGMIDFYFSCNDILAYDLSICLNTWCFDEDGSYNFTKSSSLLQGYNSIRQLSKKEIKTLPLLARGAALRFFLTRLYDYLTISDSALVIKKDPLEYLQKLRSQKKMFYSTGYGL